MKDPDMTINPSAASTQAEKNARPREKDARDTDFEVNLKTSQDKLKEKEHADDMLNGSSPIPWGSIFSMFNTVTVNTADKMHGRAKELDASPKENGKIQNIDAGFAQGQRQPQKADLSPKAGDTKEAKAAAVKTLSQIIANNPAGVPFQGTVNMDELMMNLEKISNRTSMRDIADQIVKSAKLLKSDGKTELVIELKPEWLGNITLNISTKDGVLNVQIFAGEKAKQLLDASIQELRDELASSNLNVGNLQVSVGDGNRSSGDNEKGEEEIKVSSIAPAMPLNISITAAAQQDAAAGILQAWNSDKQIFSKV